MTERKICGKIEPKLRLGDNLVLKFPYRKGKTAHTTKIVRVCDGVVYALDPSTKEQVAVGQALWIGSILVMAMAVEVEE